jgi:hypothetical protein
VDILSSDSVKNHSLAALPHAESQRWLPLLEPVDLPLGEVLYESGTTLSHVYFPTTAIISLLYSREESQPLAVRGQGSA